MTSQELEDPYILSCPKCSCMISDGEYQLEYCVNCFNDVKLNPAVNYKKCDKCRKYYMADCNTYHCSSCGELLELMNPDIVYCLCGYANSVKDTSFCASCWNPLTKDTFLEIFPEHHEIHKTDYDLLGNFCTICGIDQRVKELEYKPKACVVCLDNIANHAFIPCGHLSVCESCSSFDFKNQCPVCRVDIVNICKIWM